MSTLKDKKNEVQSLAELLMKLSPEERENIRRGVIIGKTIFKTDTKKTTKAG